ncbi:MAG: cytochrome c nitrite reductase small subunit [Kiritimatiellae bacterium]|nr:cytochrome c nitrite reductase small subunit [Kiritimatiellia bacterium]
MRARKQWLLLEGMHPAWRLAVFTMGGVLLGMAVLVTHISRAASYLSDEPEVCINCHVMNSAYATWRNGSHGHVAACVDCHLPHQNPVAKLAFKGMDGARHSYVFTFRLEPQVLELSRGAIPVIQENCLRCHHDQLQMVRLAGVTERRCWDCHDNVHGSVISLSASPDARRPALPSAGLEWFKKQTGEQP